MTKALFATIVAAILCTALPVDGAGDVREPVTPLATRVQEAERVFVGVLVNRKDLEGDWCHADLKVTQAIKGVKVGELVPVLWRPKIARYDAKNNQTGLALLKYQHEKRYWLRPDTFEDAKLAEQAVKPSDKVDVPTMSVEDGLKLYVSGKLPPEDFQVIYSDMHGLHGGMTITIDGDGKVRKESVDPRKGRKKEVVGGQVKASEVRSLAEKLLADEAWRQKVDDRPAVPDESKATLKIKTAGGACLIWEWYNDLKKNDRLIKHREVMQRLVNTAEIPGFKDKVQVDSEPRNDRPQSDTGPQTNPHEITEKLVRMEAFRWLKESVAAGKVDEAVRGCELPFYFDGHLIETEKELRAQVERMAAKAKRNPLHFHENLTVVIHDKDMPKNVKGFSWENVWKVAVRVQAKIEKVETVVVFVRIAPAEIKDERPLPPLRIVGFRD